MATSIGWGSTSSYTVTKDAQVYSLALTYTVTSPTGVLVNFASSAAWAAVSPESTVLFGSGTLSVAITITENTAVARTAKIAVAVLADGSFAGATLNQEKGSATTGRLYYWVNDFHNFDVAASSAMELAQIGLPVPGGVALMPGQLQVASSDASWLTISSSKIPPMLTPTTAGVTLTVTKNDGAARIATITIADLAGGTSDTIEVIQAGGSGAPGASSKEIINGSIMNHILPFINDGKPAPECPYAPIYPDSKRTGQDVAVPVVKVTDYLFEPLEPTSDDLVLDMNTGFLLPKTFKAALFSLGNVFTDTLVPDSFVAPAGTTGANKTRVKLSSGSLGTASGPNGSFYITYGVFDASLIRRDDDLHTSWSGSMNSVTPSKNSTLDPGDEAKVEIMKVLQPLASSGTGQRVVVEDLASPQPAAMCGAVQIGVRPALVKSGGTAAFVASATATPDGFPWSSSAQLAVQSTAAQVVVPISFLCAACGKTTPAMAAALVTEYAQRAAWTIAEAARRHLIPAYTASGITPEAKGWLSCGVEAKCEPQQVQGRPDLYFATLQVNAVVPVRLGKGV